MRLNIHLALLATLLFLMFSSTYYITSIYKTALINNELQLSLKSLETNFNITSHHNKTDAESVNSFIQKNSSLLNILSNAKDANKTQRAIYRDEIYKKLISRYTAMKVRGILQFQFIFPDNTSFLRMHKPSKFGDDLSNVRESIKQTNRTHKPSFGFEHGRTSHAFRNIFPLFYKKIYIGCYEVSFASESIQKNLSEVNKIHSHFLVRKDIFEANSWQREDMVLKYVPSIEHQRYMIALIGDTKIKSLRYSEKNIIAKHKDEINSKIQQKLSFSFYEKLSNGVKVVSFLRIKNTQGSDVVAYIVSYTSNIHIDEIIATTNLIYIISFLFIFVFLVMLYFQILRMEEVRNKSDEQEHLLSLFNQGEITLFKWDNNDTGSISHVSENVEKLTGYTKEEFESKKISYTDIIHHEDVLNVHRELKNAVDNKVNLFTHQSYRLVTKNGEIKWTYDNTNVIRNANGDVTHFLGYVIDITDIKKQELALKISQDNLSQAQSDANIGSYKFNLITQDLEWSKQYYVIMRKDIHNYTPSLENFLYYIHHNDVDFVNSNIQDTIANNIRNEFEYRLNFDNEIVHVRSTSQISKVDENANPIEMTGTIQNITSKKLLEIKLNNLNANLEKEIHKKSLEGIKRDKIVQEQAKLAAMGEMVGAIAHQWRQPLNSLNINIQNLDDDYADGLIDSNFIDDFISKQSKTIRFMSQTIDDFRNFFRIDKIKKKFNVKDSIEQILNIQNAQLKNSNIALTLSGDGFEIISLESEFHQTILNLISNAKDAILQNHIEHGEIKIHLSQNTIKIQDNALGIKSDIFHRIFEPYFTTKEQGKGTGMGLYIAKMIIEQNMGGKLSVKNTSFGAEFTIQFESNL